MSASVKVMLSYDYCHFEICKGTDEAITNEGINELRKDCQRLADEAVRQYAVSKEKARANLSYDKQQFLAKVSKIQEKEENLRNIEEVAMLKHYQDAEWEKNFEPYDYEDEDEREW